jgi:hypothetical protein
MATEMVAPVREESSSTLRPPTGVRNFFATQRNKFGLFCQYCTEEPPSHDPKEHVTLDDLREAPVDEEVQLDVSGQDYYPYPNRNAFRLGDWYWNGGAQKSQASFKELVDIVGDPTFRPDDIRNARWDHVHHVLADEEGWFEDDAGWEKTPVSISIPFQARRNASTEGGPKEYVIGDLYHHNIVSVVREKLSSPANDD